MYLGSPVAAQSCDFQGETNKETVEELYDLTKTHLIGLDDAGRDFPEPTIESYGPGGRFESTVELRLNRERGFFRENIEVEMHVYDYVGSYAGDLVEYAFEEAARKQIGWMRTICWDTKQQYDKLPRRRGRRGSW